MPGFMLVAGYFAARRIDNCSIAGKRILLSAQHYALPFFSWFILVNCLLRGGYGRNPITALETLLTHVDSGLWFLWVVFILSSVTTLANQALTSEKGRILKTVAVMIVSFGIFAGVGIVSGINFLGVKYILYYAVFYGFGWLLRWTENWWKQWWPKVCNAAVAIALIVFLAIVFNYDLYHAQDNLIGIVLRCIAGLTGNCVLLWFCRQYREKLAELQFGWIGMYTLEIYCVHVNYTQLIRLSDNGLFSLTGFHNFAISFAITLLFTLVTICVFRSIPAFNYLFFGRNKN